MRRITGYSILILLLASCIGASTTPTPTPITISKVIATVEISATPNAEQAAATRAAITPTLLPPTQTVIPSETPYIGIFRGEAERDLGYTSFTEPIFGIDDVAEVRPTANAQACSIPIDAPYLVTWQIEPDVSQRMGCPIQEGFGFFGRVQLFETGVMYYYPDLNAIWAIITGVSPRFEYLENPPDESTVGILPPTGLLIPGNVFGDMWVTVPDLQDRLGFARTDQQEIGVGIQRFANGTFLYDTDAEQVYALITDGTVLGPFASGEVAINDVADDGFEGESLIPQPSLTPSDEQEGQDEGEG